MSDMTYPNHLPDSQSWRKSKTPDLYGNLDSLLAGAAKQGILSERPTSEEESQTSNYEVLASAIGERLSLLGYTSEESHAARHLYVRDREAFFQAVEAFQSDAGLKPDRWAGKKTWTALGYLVNFGADENDYADMLPEDLLECNPELGAVKRAAKLRLRVLGLSSARPSNGSPRPSKTGVVKFLAIAKKLGMLDPQHSEDELEPESVRVLLNHDAMVKRLSEVRDPIERAPSQATYNDIKQFIVKVALIELWLLGLDVDITMKRRYPVAQVRGAKRRRHPEDTPIGKYLMEFYRAFTKTDEDAIRHKAGLIDHGLFETFESVDHEGAAIDEEKAAGELREEIERRLPDQGAILDALKKGRSLGLQIWDGIKRVWRWIRRKVKDLIKIGRNLIRAFFRYASAGFRIARTAVRALGKSLTAYLSGRLQFPDEKDTIPAVCVRLYKDFDMRIGINQDADPAILEKSRHRILLFSQRFLLSCRILSIVIDGLLAAASSFAGWALLAKGLIHHLREIIPLYRSIVGIEEQLAA